jgi:hypothetical protein
LDVDSKSEDSNGEDSEIEKKWKVVTWRMKRELDEEKGMEKKR